MKDEPHMQRLAILYPKAIGDFMFILPALHTIRRAFAETHITLVVKDKQAPLAIPQEGILADKVLSLGKQASWRTVRQHLADKGVDTVLDMAGNDKSGLILSARGGRRLRPHSVDCKGICAVYSLFAQAMPRLSPGLHRVDELLAFAQYLGATAPVYSFQLHLPDRAIEASEEMIARHDLRSGTVIALNLGASRDSKRWPAAHFGELARALVANGYRVVLTGAHEFKPDGHYDRKTVEQFRKDGLVDDESCIDLVRDDRLSPPLHLQRDTHFLRYSQVPAVVVGNDTGPLHIAGSIGTDARNRTLSLFGPTNWGRYAPYDPSRRFPDKPAGEWNHVLYVPTSCGPTGNREACRGYRRGCRHRKCMHQLSPELVLQSVINQVAAA